MAELINVHYNFTIRNFKEGLILNLESSHAPKQNTEESVYWHNYVILVDLRQVKVLLVKCHGLSGIIQRALAKYPVPYYCYKCSHGLLE